MKRRGWLIAGGLAFLWLSPFFVFLGKGAWSVYWKADYDKRGQAWAKRMAENIKYDAVTDEDRRKWREQAERDRIEAEAERDRKRSEYLASPINIPKPPSGYRIRRDDDDDGKTQYITKVVYVEREPERQIVKDQSDLTGFYWTRDFGTFQYIQGPF